MLTSEEVKDRALRMGIATGRMPEVEFIWSVQQHETGHICFGLGQRCDHENCRWRQQCLLLQQYDVNPLISKH